MDENVARAVAGIPTGMLLRRRQARGTLRSVYRVGDALVKEFAFPSGRAPDRTPWLTESSAMARLGGEYASLVIGTGEREADGVRKVFFVRRFVAGAPVEAFGEADIPELARLFADIHARGVVTDDANIGNFIKTPSGGFAFIDFGRAVTFRSCPAPPDAVGRELAKLYREGFGFDRGRLDAFHRAYFAQAHASPARRAVIIFVEKATLFLRALRKGRGR